MSVTAAQRVWENGEKAVSCQVGQAAELYSSRQQQPVNTRRDEEPHLVWQTDCIGRQHFPGAAHMAQARHKCANGPLTYSRSVRGSRSCKLGIKQATLNSPCNW